MERPHVLWVEIGFGIAIAAFAAIVVLGQNVSTATYVALELAFLAVFVIFAVFAEGAAHRAEQMAEAKPARRPLGSGRGAPTGV